MDDSLCPFCGAAHTEVGWSGQWDCGSAREHSLASDFKIQRSDDCHTREVATLRDKVKKLQKTVDRYIDNYNEAIRRGTI